LSEDCYEGPGSRGSRGGEREKKTCTFYGETVFYAPKEIFYKRIDLFLDNILEILYLYNIPGMRIVPIVAPKNVLNY
jgi:hypothetical protein